MLPGVYITDTDGNIGTVTESVEDVCGLLFDVSAQTSFGTDHATLKDKVIQLTSAADASTKGITSSVLGGIAAYHVEKFFERRGGTGRLYVLFADCDDDWAALSKMQRYAHGLIYQVAVWTEQSIWNVEDDAASTYQIGLLSGINSECVNIANNMNAPISVLLYPNTNKLGGSKGSTATFDFNKIPTVKNDYRYVSVMLGETNEEAVVAYQTALTSKAPVGACGVDLAVLSQLPVPSCIGYVAACDYSGQVPGILMGFGANKLPYEDLSTADLNDLHNRGYNFFMKYEGDEVGVYRNFDHTCTDGDYRTIARNRTIGKVRRQVRAALLPLVNKTVLIDPTNGYMTAGAQSEFINAVTDVLNAMVTAKEISSFTTPKIIQTASILKTDTVYINFSVIPLGVASAINVSEGLAITA